MTARNRHGPGARMPPMRRPGSVVAPLPARVLGRLLATVLASGLLLLGPGAGAASAHDALAGSAPAADAAVPAPPAVVTLEFAEPPQALGNEVRVLGPGGTPVSVGDPDVNGTTVTQPLAVGLPAGIYAVEWRVAAADGHPVSGTFAFTASGGAQPVPAGTGELPAAAATPTGTPVPWVWVTVGGIVAAGGALVVRRLSGPA